MYDLQDMRKDFVKIFEALLTPRALTGALCVDEA